MSTKKKNTFKIVILIGLIGAIVWVLYSNVFQKNTSADMQNVQPTKSVQSSTPIDL
ncbi:MAG: hypothetical protein PHV62_03310 [Sulfuricurvum sp.]|nr:hypothetical protein [Sulfuricurvum sp.]